MWRTWQSYPPARPAMTNSLLVSHGSSGAGPQPTAMPRAAAQARPSEERVRKTPGEFLAMHVAPIALESLAEVDATFLSHLAQA